MQSGLAGTLVRWLLPAFLAVALLGMHHLPAADEGGVVSAGHHADLRPDAAAGPPVAQPGGSHCCTVSSLPTVEPRDPSGGHGSGHELLHLCLAVLAALAGIVLALFAAAWSPAGSNRGSAAPRSPPVFCARPPPPQSRRLAALGVLRL
ncbi:hypothetical protein [Nocardia sp. NPDC019395]|uniref:hypothetical protein n=1 Tax=Nocardia sp. NPDC019395 TaxID=3154686 RepID=UPI0033FFD033